MEPVGPTIATMALVTTGTAGLISIAPFAIGAAVLGLSGAVVGALTAVIAPRFISHVKQAIDGAERDIFNPMVLNVMSTPAQQNALSDLANDLVGHENLASVKAIVVDDLIEVPVFIASDEGAPDDDVLVEAADDNLDVRLSNALLNRDVRGSVWQKGQQLLNQLSEGLIQAKKGLDALIGEITKKAKVDLRNAQLWVTNVGKAIRSKWGRFHGGHTYVESQEWNDYLVDIPSQIHPRDPGSEYVIYDSDTEIKIEEETPGLGVEQEFKQDQQPLPERPSNDISKSARSEKIKKIAKEMLEGVSDESDDDYQPPIPDERRFYTKEMKFVKRRLPAWKAVAFHCQQYVNTVEKIDAMNIALLLKKAWEKVKALSVHPQHHKTVVALAMASILTDSEGNKVMTATLDLSKLTAPRPVYLNY